MEPSLNHPALAPSASTSIHGPSSFPDLHGYHTLPAQYSFSSQTLPPLQGQHSSNPSPLNGILAPPNALSNVSTTVSSQTPLPTSRLTAFPTLIPQFSTNNHVAQVSQSAGQRFPGAQAFMSMPPALQPSYTQPIAPAPPRDRLPDFRPSLAGLNALDPQQSSRWTITPDSLTKSAVSINPPSPRTHVVGSQGRRGPLPSDPGRPAVNANAKTTIIPQKDADGKFPCPHCQKTYLHAKHLKRHLLRHTGDRPYMCVLCKDTFSRSDILKRHFQKCSLRRGNPTGASHLSNPQAHLRKNKNAAAATHVPRTSVGASAVPATTNGINNLTNGYLPHPNNSMNGLVSNQPSYMGHTSAVPFATSSSTTSSVAAPDLNNAYFYQGTSTASSTSMMPHEPGVPASNFQAPLSGQNGVLDWAGMFPPAAQENYLNPMFSTSMGQEQTPAEVTNATLARSYPTPTDSQHQLGINEMYLPSSGFGPDGSFSAFNIDLPQNDPMQSKVAHLVDFLCPPGTGDAAALDRLKRLLTPESIRHFLGMFSNFQGHWPFIHLPTFNFLQSYDGYIMAIVCIGAVYSDRIDASQVRDLMQRTKASIERTSTVFRNVSADVTLDKPESHRAAIMLASDFDEVQALILMQSLFMWHGSPTQRANARAQFYIFPRIARKYGLFKVVRPGETTSYSRYHQPKLNPQEMDLASWDWASWLDQEKRSRLMYHFFLVDSALVIYFNQAPQIDASQIEIPLPADDATWDARSSQECADSLGLRGVQFQRNVNINGTRRIKQPEMHEALNVLLHPTWEFQPRTTNVHSKFILIHALLVRMWLAQRSTLPGPLLSLTAAGTFPSYPHTPTSQNDWLSANSSRSNSGNCTPNESPNMNNPAQVQLSKIIPQAINKWKKIWDQDMVLEYPPSTTTRRRFGFCRDGHHFFWLALYMLKNGKPNDTQTPPDARLLQVMQTLKFVRQWATNDSANRGEDLGSVAEIDDSYGVSDLNLDMKMLFRPIDQQLDSAMRGVQPPGGGSGVANGVNAVI